MACALISCSMPSTQPANIMGVYHSKLKTLWVQGNSVNAQWIISALSVALELFFYDLFL